MMGEIPKSVRQIGRARGSRRIYIEDYVWTFSRQMARQAGEAEAAGVLLGKTVIKKGERYLFISGMVEIEDFMLRTSEEFSQEMWTSIYSGIKENFTNLEILGWFYTKAEIPLACTERMEQVHQQNFKGNDKLLFLYEDGEGEDAFFAMQSGKMERQPGYYIYYEKNPEMQEYMVTHKKHSRIDDHLEEKALGDMRGILEKKQQEKEEKQERGARGLMVGLAALAILCGWLALRNQDALTKVENQMTTLRQSLSEQTQKPSQTTVETLSANVATITPAAMTATPAAISPSPTPIKIVKEYDIYQVKKGDTLSSIAGKYYSDINLAEKIRRYNGLKKDSVILVGQKLKLPLN